MDASSQKAEDDAIRNKDQSDKGFYTKVLFFIGISSVAAIGSFGTMLSRTETEGKRKPGVKLDPAAMETGASLARKALGQATIYAVGGFSAFCFISWKLIGARDFVEFREIVGRKFPKIHRPREPEHIDWDEILYGKPSNGDTENKST